MSNLLKDNIELMKEYDFDKNQTVILDNITIGSSRKIWWKCGKNHKWQATPFTRKKGHGCPFCSGRLPIKGIDDLMTTNPELLKEWDYEKNKISPSDIGKNSSMKVWWKCEKGHSYESYIFNRTNHNTGCPYCANKKVLKGFNDIKSFNSIVASEWNKEKNLKEIDQFTYASNKKVWWICSKCGNEWQACINHRTMRNQGCPYCNGRLPVVGETDLATTNPELLEEWDYDKNNIKPDEIKKGSHKLVWWKCKNGHSYETYPYNKTKGYGCPYCSGKKVLKGFNDLATTNPELLEEWNYEKNTVIDINSISRGSDTKVWWKCSLCQFEWQTKVNTRAVGGCGCPNCHKYLGTSFPEQAILYYLLKNDVSVESRILISNLELDIYIPNMNVGIEYDGYQWHKNIINRDNNKDEIIKNSNIKLIRIREHGLEKTKSALNIFRANKSIKDLEIVISKLFDELKINANDIDISRDRNNIISNYMVTREKNSFAYINPDKLIMWNYEKNNPLKPEMVSANCNEKVWWKCEKCGCEWNTYISAINRGGGCPKCANKDRIITRNQNKIDFGNSLFDVFPNIAEEWDYEKNKDLTPQKILYGSGKTVWWICKNGHSYKTTINNRTNMNVGCPICAGKKILVGYNDLETTNPSLIKEWDYEKNKNFLPTQFTSGSSKKVWWKCEKGHSWETPINRRTKRNTGCPYCCNRLILSGYNDLATTNPILAKEWDYQKNYPLTPNDVSCGSGKLVWWKCNECGNEWQAKIFNRTNGTGCQKCYKK